MKKIQDISNILLNNGLIINEDLNWKELKSGTTDGVLYELHINKIPSYVIKIDNPMIISATHDFLNEYKNVRLLPDLLFSDVEKGFIVYSYISGETHFNRGLKIEWMTILIKELFNNYKKVDKITTWGRINGISRNTWSDFNQESFESAQMNIGDFLSSEDHKRVEKLANKLKEYPHNEQKYYLHGDAGVHNFIYLDNQLRGVIDPSPLIGPSIYDFTYAFCSSPDSLDLNTLLPLFSLWEGGNSITEEQLLDEVLFQLYTRIGVCINVHPHDLDVYMVAWEKWKGYLPTN
ncbi:hypothetical protein [Falsibacillus pallidus]|uniref:Phosphotransferase family enzyme n=1 Tax=Falsibacillus pallidus TaxID=493781 RepID=A0A370GD28_9BACI|nr:hypothetical protein [Falsibacillus pallidus]RDI41096.1 hypothetical protein DFR59_110100 [Falsibacillus pallidus]